jgi:hypothetical protein
MRPCPRACTQLARSHAADARGRYRGALGGIDLRGFDEPFRARQDRGQVDVRLHPPVVVLAARVHARSFQREMAHARQKREIEQLRQLGRHLPGVGVDRVAAGEDQFERARAADGGRQRVRSRQRVGARERGVGDEDAVDVDIAREAPCDRFAQCVVGGRWSEREYRDARVGADLRELDSL